VLLKVSTKLKYSHIFALTNIKYIAWTSLNAHQRRRAGLQWCRLKAIDARGYAPTDGQSPYISPFVSSDATVDA